MKKKSYLLMLKVVLFHFKEKFKDEKKKLSSLFLPRTGALNVGLSSF